MREILFRAKAKHNNEWVYGDLNQHKTGKKFIKCGSATQSYEVIPETVGQYTGLTDKNGTKIFEGDIVRRYDNVERVFYDGGGFSPFAIPGWECTPDADECEVVGNIHDNLELLANK